MPTPEQDLNAYHDRIDAERRADEAYQAERLDAIADVDDDEILNAFTALEKGIRATEGKLLQLAVVFDKPEFNVLLNLVDEALDSLIDGLDDAVEVLGDEAWTAVENPERYTP